MTRVPPCPDCIGEWDGTELTHLSTCPLRIALQRVIDADAAWFTDHPAAAERRRPVTPAEIAHCAATTIGVALDPQGRVRVVRCAGDDLVHVLPVAGPHRVRGGRP